jgi:hypothetical protein
MRQVYFGRQLSSDRNVIRCWVLNPLAYALLQFRRLNVNPKSPHGPLATRVISDLDSSLGGTNRVAERFSKKIIARYWLNRHKFVAVGLFSTAVA